MSHARAFNIRFRSLLDCALCHAYNYCLPISAARQTRDQASAAANSDVDYKLNSFLFSFVRIKLIARRPRRQSLSGLPPNENQYTDCLNINVGESKATGIIGLRLIELVRFADCSSCARGCSSVSTAAQSHLLQLYEPS